MSTVEELQEQVLQANAALAIARDALRVALAENSKLVEENSRLRASELDLLRRASRAEGRVAHLSSKAEA